MFGILLRFGPGRNSDHHQHTRQRSERKSRRAKHPENQYFRDADPAFRIDARTGFRHVG
jgi:hypothetical protein